VTPESVGADGEVQVSVEVVNTGARAGDEVVQFYTRTDGASVTRPVKELRGFKRVSTSSQASGCASSSRCRSNVSPTTTRQCSWQSSQPPCR
jgi:hypothetical protein